MHRLKKIYLPKRLACISLLAILSLAALPLPKGRAQSANDSRPGKDAGGGPHTVFGKGFAGESVTEDPYGHGTHAASAAAGNGRLSGQSSTFSGVAPNATIFNLRVLDGHGAGRVSTVLAALDCLLRNGSKYKVRVVRLSLGAPADGIITGDSAVSPDSPLVSGDDTEHMR